MRTVAFELGPRRCNSETYTRARGARAQYPTLPANWKQLFSTVRDNQKQFCISLGNSCEDLLLQTSTSNGWCPYATAVSDLIGLPSIYRLLGIAMHCTQFQYLLHFWKQAEHLRCSCIAQKSSKRNESLSKTATIDHKILYLLFWIKLSVLKKYKHAHSMDQNFSCMNAVYFIFRIRL